MLTYRCRNVMQDDADADVVGGGGSRFGPPASETNETHPPNKNNDGTNKSGALLLRRVVNAETTRIRGPSWGKLAQVNPGLTMSAAGMQATRQSSIGAVKLISALTNNTIVPTTTAQGVQLPPKPPTQPVQQPAGAVVVPTPMALPKGAVVAKLLAMNDTQTKEELEGQQEPKAQTLVLQGAVLITAEPIILGYVVGKTLTIKAVHSTSRFFVINGDADLLQKEIGFLGDQEEFSTPASILFPGNWCEWRTKKGVDENEEVNMYFKLRENVNTFWAPLNSGATAHVDM